MDEQLDYEAEVAEEPVSPAAQVGDTKTAPPGGGGGGGGGGGSGQHEDAEDAEHGSQLPLEHEAANPPSAPSDRSSPRPSRVRAPSSELEEGELSDEDEETRKGSRHAKERLKPQPVCRFYSKGQCTWGTSCRFLHPGVLDKGNYSMFSEPKPILPGADQVMEEKAQESQEAAAAASSTSSDAAGGTGSREPGAGLRPTLPPRPETAWERGLRQAKEMRKKSQQRKETDTEYEEKRTTMSLTQAEIDKENDYYARKASPLYEDNFSDYDDPYEPPSTSRRIPPPPPDDFYGASADGYDRRNARYPHQSMYSSRYPGDDVPSRRRVAPPRSPEPDTERGRIRGRGEEWQDPWMRKDRGRSSGHGSGRRRSYSSASTRSSSSSSSSRSESRSRSRNRSRSRSMNRSRTRSRSRVNRNRKGYGRRGRSSSNTSDSSRSRSSPSRSSSPPPRNIPHRPARRSSSGSPSRRRLAVPKTVSSNAAPLQKRLGALASNLRKIKKEPDDGAKRSTARRRSSSGSSSRSPSPPPARIRKIKQEPGINKPAIVPEVSLDKASRPSKNSGELPAKPAQIKMTLKSTSASAKMVNRAVLEKLGVHHDEDDSAQSPRRRQIGEIAGAAKKSPAKEGKKSKDKKSSVDRREELIRQLRAVENAIAKKRTKIGD